jgi:hypothetical protein
MDEKGGFPCNARIARSIPLRKNRHSSGVSCRLCREC